MDNRGQSILRIYLGVTFGPLPLFFFGMQIFWYPDVV